MYSKKKKIQALVIYKFQSFVSVTLKKGDVNGNTSRKGFSNEFIPFHMRMMYIFSNNGQVTKHYDADLFL